MNTGRGMHWGSMIGSEQMSELSEGMICRKPHFSKYIAHNLFTNSVATNIGAERSNPISDCSYGLMILV